MAVVGGRFPICPEAGHIFVTAWACGTVPIARTTPAARSALRVLLAPRARGRCPQVPEWVAHRMTWVEHPASGGVGLSVLDPIFRGRWPGRLGVRVS